MTQRVRGLLKRVYVVNSRAHLILLLCQSSFGYNRSMTTVTEDEWRAEWYPYESGATKDEIGPAQGYIMRDEELGDPDDSEDADARVTLEQGRAENPGFFVTATLYGWLFHTAYFPNEVEGNAGYETIKVELTALADLIPYEEDGAKRIQEKAQQLTEAVAAFEARYPVAS